MKYLEEISPGDTFRINNNLYLLTIDFKKNGYKLCYSLESGTPKWLCSQTIVEHYPVYYLDKENNVVQVKIKEKSDAISTKT